MFREFVRYRIYDSDKTFTKTFLRLDQDRDGKVSAADLLSFLRSVGTNKPGAEEEILKWFGEYTDTPELGLDCSYFAKFLASPSVPITYKTDDVSEIYRYCEPLTEEQRTTLQTYFISHMQQMRAANVNQYYNALTKGQNQLYCHYLRPIVEQFEYRMLLDDEWKVVERAIKTNRLVHCVTRDELAAFVEGKCVYKTKYDINDEPVTSEEREPESETELAYQPDQETMTSSISHPKPIDEQRVEECDPRIHVQSPKPRPRTPGTLSLRLTAPTGNAAERMRSIGIQGDGQAIYVMLSYKFNLAGSPRTVFSRLDQQRTGLLPVKVFAQRVRTVFGLEFYPAQLQAALNFATGKTVKCVDYKTFLCFYDQQRILGGDGASSACQNEQRNCIFAEPEESKKNSCTGNISRKDEDDKMLISQTMDESIKKGRDLAQKSRTMTEEQRTATYATSQGIAYYGPTKIEYMTTDGSSERLKESHAVTSNIVAHIKYILSNRQTSLKQIIRDTYPNRETLTQKECVWLFRNKVGVSYAVEALVETCGITDGKVKARDLISLFDSK